MRLDWTVGFLDFELSGLILADNISRAMHSQSRLWAAPLTWVIIFANLGCVGRTGFVDVKNINKAGDETGDAYERGDDDGQGDPLTTCSTECVSVDPCLIGYCDGGTCAYLPSGEGVRCDDQLFCNGEDACDGMGVCANHEGVPCSVPDVCNELDDACSLDTDPPVLLSFVLAEGATYTTALYNSVALSGYDSGTPITQFCIHLDDNTPPTPSDACWRDVRENPPGLAVSQSFVMGPEDGFYLRLGMLPAAFVAYAWLQDSAGNLSVMSNSGVGTLNVDRYQLEYVPGTPPTLSNILVTGVDAPNNPPTLSQRSIPMAADVFVKWSAIDSEGLSPAPISLWYTTDDQTYVLIASDLVDGANTGCTVNHPATTADDNATGCYRWVSGSPTEGFYRLRIGAKDTDEMMTMVISTPVNAPQINLLAGNTYPGTDGSARAAAFLPRVGASDDGRSGDHGSFVVLPSGRIFFRDVVRGILEVDPVTGVQSVFIPTTGISTGDGGPIRDATLRLPARMALDADYHLLILDVDRIRQVDLDSRTIDTLIGGGSDTGDTVPNARDVQLQFVVSTGYLISDKFSFFGAPNGDVYFASEQEELNARMRVYRAATGVVESIHFAGTGDHDNPSQDISLCGLRHFGAAFDPISHAMIYAQIAIVNLPDFAGCDAGQSSTYSSLDPITMTALGPHPDEFDFSRMDPAVIGLDGQLYRFHVGLGSAGIYRFDIGTATWTFLVGSDATDPIQGVCPDGTAATSCAINAHDVFVDAQSQVYFMDNGVVRTIDASGAVRTLFGQSRFYGDGGHPLDARFNDIVGIGFCPNDRYVIFDRSEYRFREVMRDISIFTIAGNGSASAPQMGVDATETSLESFASWINNEQFVVDPVTCDVYHSNSGSGHGEEIARLDRTVGQWVFLAGGGATDYVSGDGSPGSQLFFTFAPQPIAFNGSQILAALTKWNDTLDGNDAFLKLYSLTDGTQSHLAGVVGATTGFCADGTATASCSVCAATNCTYAFSTYDENGGAPRWLVFTYGSRIIRTFDEGGTVQALANLPSGARSFAHRHSADSTTNLVYYCRATDGHLYAYDLNTSTNTALPWPITAMACVGRSLIYDDSRQSLVFSYAHLGLTGVAEYLLP